MQFFPNLLRQKCCILSFGIYLLFQKQKLVTVDHFAIWFRFKFGQPFHFQWAWQLQKLQRNLEVKLETIFCFIVFVVLKAHYLTFKSCEIPIPFMRWLPLFKAGETNLFAIAGHFVSYCWVSGAHNFLVILWNLLKTKKLVHQQKQTKVITAGLAWMLRGPYKILLWAACSSPLI